MTEHKPIRVPNGYDEFVNICTVCGAYQQVSTNWLYNGFIRPYEYGQTIVSKDCDKALKRISLMKALKWMP